jgi:Na+/melibiose symporter-like transporter
MSLVDDHHRGRFTANKEMVSLISGMIFSFVMGNVIDHFEAIGNLNGAFIICGITIFILMLSHTLVLIFSKEKPVEVNEKTSTKSLIKELLSDKNLFKVILIPTLWAIVSHVSIPFYGSYQIKELGFTMTFVSVLSIVYAIVRTLFSRPLGRFADKHSFASMLNICFIIMVVGFTISVFTTPSNGKIFYTAYYVLYAVAMAGINSSVINLIYDYVDKEKRMSALALSSTFSGFAGFFATLIVSPLVTYIQNNGNTFLGISVYAQQVVSLIAVILSLLLLLYLNTVVRKLQLNSKK